MNFLLSDLRGQFLTINADGKALVALVNIYLNGNIIVQVTLGAQDRNVVAIKVNKKFEVVSFETISKTNELKFIEFAENILIQGALGASSVGKLSYKPLSKDEIIRAVLYNYARGIGHSITVFYALDLAGVELPEDVVRAIKKSAGISQTPGHILPRSSVATYPRQEQAFLQDAQPAPEGTG